MADYKDERIIEGVLDRYANSRMKPFIRSARRAVRLGQETGESAAENLRSLADARGWKSGKVERSARKLATIPTVAIEPTRYDYLTPITEITYKNIFGRSATPDELGEATRLAGAYRINPSDPGAFSALLSDIALSSPEGQSKYKTEGDLLWEQMYGNMPRDSEGNLRRGLMAYNPETVSSLIGAMLG
jgi:hypothetical protein